MFFETNKPEEKQDYSHSVSMEMYIDGVGTQKFTQDCKNNEEAENTKKKYIETMQKAMKEKTSELFDDDLIIDGSKVLWVCVNVNEL